MRLSEVHPHFQELTPEGPGPSWKGDLSHTSGHLLSSTYTSQLLPYAFFYPGPPTPSPITAHKPLWFRVGVSRSVALMTQALKHSRKPWDKEDLGLHVVSTV